MAMDKLGPGIYRGKYSVRAVVNTNRHGRREKKFPFGTPLLEIKRWRAEQQGQLAAKARRQPKQTAARGTLRADVERYLKRIQGLVSWKSRRSELDAWIEALPPTKRREQITEDMLRAVISKWRSKGRNVGTPEEPKWKAYSVRTCHHRLGALRHLYHMLDGPDMPTPCDRITFTLPQPKPVYVPSKLVVKVARALSDPKAKARLMVMAATGVRPAELMRATIDDFDLEQNLWWIRTAKGGERPPLHLNREMRAAIDAFITAAAWGKYDTGTHAKLLYEAGWPKTIRPYNVRAAFGMDLSRSGTDLADIQQMMGHRHQSTTRAFYVPPDASRLAAASRSLNDRFGWAPKKKAAKKARPTVRS